MSELCVYFQSAEEVDFSGNGITAVGIEAFDGILQINTALKTLNLSGNDIGDEGAKVFSILWFPHSIYCSVICMIYCANHTLPSHKYLTSLAPTWYPKHNFDCLFYYNIWNYFPVQTQPIKSNLWSKSELVDFREPKNITYLWVVIRGSMIWSPSPNMQITLLILA